MIVRLGYVAMSMLVHNASPSKTMTATHFMKLDDREAAIRKLEKIASDNIHNTLRLLKHNRAYDIELYRCSSKLIPLWSHELLAGWDPMEALRSDFEELGAYAKEHRMRISFHPDHYTVLNTPREEVLRNSIQDLKHHVLMLEAMGFDTSAKNNIHIGGTYGDKPSALQRFTDRFVELPESVRLRMTLENDDKTFTALETLQVCEKVGAPMVLDIHHHQVNHNGEKIGDLWPRILKTWSGQMAQGGTELLPPKIHVSSPKNDKDVRSHADFIDISVFMAFLRSISSYTRHLDVMIEAKKKDEALLRLMEDVRLEPDVVVLTQASFKL